MPQLAPDITTVLDAFAPLFSNSVWINARILLVGAVLCIGKRTVTSSLKVMGLAQQKEFSKYHRVLNRARWNMLAGSKILLGLLIALVPRREALVFAVDDHIERRKGNKITKKGCYRDAVRSSRKKVVHCFGLKWVSLMLIVKLPWSDRKWALPVLTTLATSKKYDQAHNRRHKTSIDWAVQMITLLRRWIAHRAIVLVADGGFAAVKLALCCAGLPPAVTLVCKMRLDAALYDPPPARKPSQRGKTPKKGKKQRSLGKRLDDRSIQWTTIRVRWYDGQLRTLEFFSGVSLWCTSGLSPVQIRWVVLRDPKGMLRTEALLCTDIDAEAEQIVAWYVVRWNIEVTFEELRAHLGMETQRQWNDLAIARTTPALFSVFSLVVLMANRMIKDGKLPIQEYPWYHKSEATFSDAIAIVRRDIWQSRYCANSSRRGESLISSGAFLDILLQTVCYAA